jgi:acetyl esterase/lipase
MKRLTFAVGLLVACNACAQPAVWQPSGGHAQVPLWPGTPPNPNIVPGPENLKTGTRLIGGKPITGVYNVSQPTVTVYAPTGPNTGAAIVVIPGGGFEGLAMDLEGTDVCDWLSPIGVTCILLKYRVPSPP